MGASPLALGQRGKQATASKLLSHLPRWWIMVGDLAVRYHQISNGLSCALSGFMPIFQAKILPVNFLLPPLIFLWLH